MLSEQEVERYNRHIILPEIGLEGQQKLKQAKVLVVGAGGLGCPILQYLTAAGIGTLGIIDHDVVSMSNLQRQILFTEEDLGKPKVEVAKVKLLKQNPHINIVSYNSRLTTHNTQLIQEYDIIVDGTDNFPTRYLLNDACLLYNKPLVFGSIFKFEGQVSVFNYQNGPTYRCLFPEPPQSNEVPNCSEIGVIGVLPGIIGTMQANETIKLITGIGHPLSARLFIFDALSNSSNIIHFKRNEEAIQEFLAQKTTLDSQDYSNTCHTGQEPSMEEKFKKLRKISVAELSQKIREKEIFQLIDVRDIAEYEQANLGGTLIPLSNLENNIEKIKRDVPVVIHCQGGTRSKKAILLLQEKYGFTNLSNLEGGMRAWLNQ